MRRKLAVLSTALAFIFTACGGADPLVTEAKAAADKVCACADRDCVVALKGDKEKIKASMAKASDSAKAQIQEQITRGNMCSMKVMIKK